MERTYFLISAPDEFREKLIGFLKNLNVVNDGCPIKLEKIYIQPKYVAIPKEKKYEGENRKAAL